ncbi:ABC transporter ATP-binding protein/permease [Streptomyces sp. P38-E01]|uniref:ABC transporter ATP-binding protein/permease n=1 Tax=Streptomyces tardus TaxID=2780544 RepID=A0A949N2Y9_9ACTN|nr:ABC transporter ATP-binding protein [Streptomyces tardus]MBU7596299.1 ABC transporter ATP-binding protein/permease [Streptomyces tardus]
MNASTEPPAVTAAVEAEEVAKAAVDQAADQQEADPSRSAVRSLLRLWPFVKPVRARLFTAAFIAIIASCTGLLVPVVLKWIVDGPVADRDTAGVWLGGGLLLAVGVAEALLFGLRRWLVARPLAGVEASMRAQLYERLQRLPVSFHDRWASGQLLSRGTTDLQLLRLFLAFPMTFLLVNGVTILVGCGILLALDWGLGLLLLLPVVPLIVLCSLFEGKYAVQARLAQDQVGDLTTVVEESVLGVRIIKGFGRHRSQARAFRDLANRLRGTELRKARLLAGIWALIMTLPELALGAALLLGTVQVADGELSAGTLVAFLSTALALRWPIDSIGFLLAMSNEAATATDRFYEVLDAPVAPDTLPAKSGAARGTDDPSEQAATRQQSEQKTSGQERTEQEPSGQQQSEQQPSEHKPTEREGGDGLRLEGVIFRFADAPESAPPVLDGVDLRIRPGETMALVGATGSGKTTLTALVPRLHELSGGRILLDGTDVATLPGAELRRRVAVAFEEPTLFSASVRENVAMGAGADADGQVSDEDVWRALRVAQADGFVSALPQGVETQVGEQGQSLSGGQRQRLALARAVVGKPRFLVLDDPLSALDVHTEARVEAALREVLSTTTALVVAHRPSTVLLADRVALLSGGRVTAVGTHHELLRDNAEYRHLMSGAPEQAPSEPELRGAR